MLIANENVFFPCRKSVEDIGTREIVEVLLLAYALYIGKSSRETRGIYSFFKCPNSDSW